MSSENFLITDRISSAITGTRMHANILSTDLLMRGLRSSEFRLLWKVETKRRARSGLFSANEVNVHQFLDFRVLGYDILNHRREKRSRHFHSFVMLPYIELFGLRNPNFVTVDHRCLDKWVVSPFTVTLISLSCLDDKIVSVLSLLRW